MSKGKHRMLKSLQFWLEIQVCSWLCSWGSQSMANLGIRGWKSSLGSPNPAPNQLGDVPQGSSNKILFAQSPFPGLSWIYPDKEKNREKKISSHFPLTWIPHSQPGQDPASAAGWSQESFKDHFIPISKYFPHFPFSALQNQRGEQAKLWKNFGFKALKKGPGVEKKKFLAFKSTSAFLIQLFTASVPAHFTHKSQGKWAVWCLESHGKEMEKPPMEREVVG